jgi:hypothetical protein
MKPGWGKTGYERSERMIWANLVYTLWIATQYQFQPGSRMAPEGAMRSETSCILEANGHTSVGSATRRLSLSLAVSVALLILAALHCAAYGQLLRAIIMAPARLAETSAPAGPGASLGGLPLSFEARQGQTDPEPPVPSKGNRSSLLASERGAQRAFDRRVNSEAENPGDRLGRSFRHTRRARDPAGLLKCRTDHEQGMCFPGHAFPGQDFPGQDFPGHDMS